MKTSDEHIDSR